MSPLMPLLAECKQNDRDSEMSAHCISARAFAAMLAAWLLAFAAFSGAHAAPADELPHVVVDRASGEVIAQNRAFERWYPASLTKLMSVYVTLRAIEAGEIFPGSPVTMSKAAAQMPPSKTGYAPGTVVRVDTALKLLVIKSANDLSVALAESVAGSVPEFVSRLNAEAARLGMTDTNFVNPNGLHSPRQYTSARDMALLARQMLEEFPQMAPVFGASVLVEGNRREYSYNLLLERYPGADGMKTGFVCASGYNIVASATRDGRQLIAVLLGAFSQTERAEEAARLLEAGFAGGGGARLASFSRQGAPVEAESQRGRICSEQALRSRVDLQPEDMKLDSPLLARRTPGTALEIALGGVDAPPSEARIALLARPKGNVPVPTPRPSNVRLDVDGEPVPPGVTAAASLPVPTPRPLR